MSRVVNRGEKEARKRQPKPPKLRQKREKQREAKFKPKGGLQPKKATQARVEAPKGKTRDYFTPRKKVVVRQLRKAARESQGGLVRKLNRGFAPGEQITPRQAAIVAEAHGLPGITYAKAIVPGESNYQPGVRNPDDGTPSLFQITPSVQSAATKAKFDKIASKHPGGYSNPIAAAKQARVLAKGSSNEGVSNYVAFNPSAPQGHLPGGPKRARQILYGEKKPIPKPLKREAKQVLGKERTQKVIKQAKTPAAAKPLPLKVLKKHIKFTEPRSEVRAEQGAPARTSLTGMNPEMQRALVRLSQNTGIPVEINEGYRTAKRANEFPSGTGSQHHQGNAADVNNHSAYTAEDLAKAGLTNTAVAGEPWHFEITNPTTTFSGSVGGSVSGGTSTYGGTTTQTSRSPSGKGTTPKTMKARRRNRSRRQLLNEILNAPDAVPVDVMEDFEASRPTTAETIKARKAKVGLK